MKDLNKNAAACSREKEREPGSLHDPALPPALGGQRRGQPRPPRIHAPPLPSVQVRRRHAPPLPTI